MVLTFYVKILTFYLKSKYFNVLFHYWDFLTLFFSHLKIFKNIFFQSWKGFDFVSWSPDIIMTFNSYFLLFI